MGDLRNVSEVCATDCADLRTCGRWGMKPIRPLFRSNGPHGTIPQCHGRFQNWIGDPLRGRLQTPVDARRGTYRTELVKQPDGNGYRLVGRPIPEPSSVPGIIAHARDRKQLLNPEGEFLRKFLIKTIEEKTYREWLSSSGLADFFYEDDWNDQDNHRKFALYAAACFVDFFRPGQLDWRTPNTNDMQLVVKLLKIFTDSTDAEKQTKLLLGLFDLDESLNGLAVEASTGLSRTDRETLLECLSLHLKGEKRARWLQGKGFEGFGKSPLTKYGENSNSLRAQISTWTRQLLND